MSVGFGCPLSLHKPATRLKQEVHRRRFLYTISILFISAEGCVVQCTHIVIRFLLCPAYLCHDMVLCVRSHPQRRNASGLALSGVLASLDGERAGEALFGL
jgi:hypothetical protein